MKEGGDNALSLKSSSSFTDLASDSIIIKVDRGGDNRPFTINRISVDTGDVPIEIVPKAEVEANKYSWTPEQANSKIALEINGTEYTAGMALRDGENTFTIYNANTVTAIPERRLLLEFPEKSSGIKTIAGIPLLYAEPDKARLSLSSYVGVADVNPITHVAQKMEEPTLGGASGELQPQWHEYSLTASEPGLGYHFAGWYDGSHSSGSKVLVTRERNFTYRIFDGSSEKNLEARYFPNYDVLNSSVKGDYLTSSAGAGFSKRYTIWTIQGERPLGGTDYIANAGDVAFVRKNGTIAETVSQADYQVTSWRGENINVTFNSTLPAGVYYPKLDGLTQGSPHPDGTGAYFLSVSKLNLRAPAGEEKTALTMKASATVSTAASDTIQLSLDTPYTDIDSLKVKSITVGTTGNPLTITAKEDIETNRAEWGWRDAHSKVALELNGVSLKGGQALNFGEGVSNTLTLYNANAIKEAFTTEVRIQVELTRATGDTMATTLVIPIKAQPTQIRAAVPLSVTLAVAPDGSIRSPENFAIQNKTTIPLTVEALKVTKEASSGVDFTESPPSVTQRNQLYGVVNIQKSSGGTERYVLSEMTDSVEQTVSWEIAPGSADAPTMLPINFDGSKMSLMTGDKLPETTMKVFSLSYTLAPMKE